MPPARTRISWDELRRRMLRPAPRLGSVRLVCLDGPAGSGKTTCARRLVAALEDRDVDVALVQLDDFYGAWDGLDVVAGLVEQAVLRPLREGRAASYEALGWQADRLGSAREVPVPDVLVLEGCGAGDRLLADQAVCLLWVEAPRELRLRRGLLRDGPDQLAAWQRWQQAEDRHYAHEGTPGRADLRLDGSGEPDPDDGLALLTG